MSYNLLSAQRLGPESLGAEWRFSKVNGARLVDKKGRNLLEGRWQRGLWVTVEHPVRTSTPYHLSLSATEQSDFLDRRLLDWHQRLGHCKMRKVWRLGTEGRLGPEKWTGEYRKVECMGCLKGKAVRLASTDNPTRALRPLVNVSVDLWGPATTKSRLGYSYFLTCYDDYSFYVHTTPLRNKSDALGAMQAYTNLVENQLERTVKVIRSDQGGEFGSNAFRDWCQSKGIEHALTPTDAHNQNARVERAHLTLMNDVRTTLVESGLPRSFWVDALLHAVYTRNRLPNKAGVVPWELFKADRQANSVNYDHL
jgi:hypothetical protein